MHLDLCSQNHTKDEMKEALRRMRVVSNSFYGPATATGCHAFIEFCGFMNEFIKVCEGTMNAGEDFLDSNTHNEKGLVMQPYEADYLAEKFDCIFGPTLRSDPKLKKIFLEKLFPEPTR